MVSAQAMLGWVVLLWAVWLVETNWALLSRARGGIVGGLRRMWSLIDNQRFLDLGGFVAGVFVGPMLIGIMLGWVGGLLSGVSLTLLGMTTQQTLVVASVSVLVAVFVMRARGS